MKLNLLGIYALDRHPLRVFARVPPTMLTSADRGLLEFIAVEKKDDGELIEHRVWVNYVGNLDTVGYLEYADGGPEELMDHLKGMILGKVLVYSKDLREGVQR